MAALSELVAGLLHAHSGSLPFTGSMTFAALPNGQRDPFLPTCGFGGGKQIPPTQFCERHWLLSKHGPERTLAI